MTTDVIAPAPRQRRGGAPHRRPFLGGAEARSAWLLIAPVGILYIVFFVGPVVFAVIQSFEKTVKSGLGLGEAKTVFVGFDNFVAVLTDPGVIAGFGRVLLIGVIQVPTMLILALVLALLFDSSIVRARQFFQTSAFLPHAIPGVIGALLWGFLYLPGVSPIVKGFEALGLHVDFLAPETVLFSVINITTWEWTGYNMIIIYAALQSIPRELFEAASIDGASGFRIATRIKVPLVAPALLITLVFSIIGSLQQFADPAVLAGITSAIDSRFTPNLAVYNLAMLENQPGQAAALSLVIALLAFVLSVAVMRVRERPERRKKETR